MKIEEAFNLKFSQVRGIFVSNTSFGIYRCFSIPEFQDHLMRMQQRLQFDEIRQKVLESLKAHIDQQEILRDFQKQSAYLRQAFDLTRACKRYHQAVEFGVRLLHNLDKSYYFDDKLLLVLQLADSYAQLGKYQDALNILNKAQFNIQLKNEPELGFLYFFNRGQWFYQVGQVSEATQDFIQAEKIARGKEIDEALLRVLFAFLCKLQENSVHSDYYQKKLRTYVDAEINLEEFITKSTMVEQSRN
jgi:tetratricopeptide (TPR) repeat protein